MPRKNLGTDVFNMAVDRMAALYKAGHRMVVSFSGGKDSCCTLEICIIAAREAGRLPVEVVLQDEEVAYPGTYEYSERIAARPEVKFHWFVMCQPMINIFNRKQPYFWCFDPYLKPEEWVRQPPAFAERIPHIDISMMTIPERFPPPEGKGLYAVIGLRTQESRGRLYGLHQSGGYITAPNSMGVRSARPIYDWSDGDVWKAIKDNQWDYNHAYDTLFTMGVRPQMLRVAPPTMNAGGINTLQIAAAAWPRWFERVCTRLPGVRTAAQFGKRVVLPTRQLGETWEQTFQRECVDEAPAWIRERASAVRDMLLSAHGRHSTTKFPDVAPCYTCHNNNGSWKQLCMNLYNGDPFSTKTAHLTKFVEPSVFRPGAPDWFVGGKPTW
jgi:predicted phosphoadenosine phosphosulfate sulfurtransferase